MLERLRKKKTGDSPVSAIETEAHSQSSSDESKHDSTSIEESPTPKKTTWGQALFSLRENIAANSAQISRDFARFSETWESIIPTITSFIADIQKKSAESRDPLLDTSGKQAMGDWSGFFQQLVSSFKNLDQLFKAISPGCNFRIIPQLPSEDQARKLNLKKASVIVQNPPQLVQYDDHGKMKVIFDSDELPLLLKELELSEYLTRKIKDQKGEFIYTKLTAAQINGFNKKIGLKKGRLLIPEEASTPDIIGAIDKIFEEFPLFIQSFDRLNLSVMVQQFLPESIDDLKKKFENFLESMLKETLPSYLKDFKTHLTRWEKDFEKSKSPEEFKKKSEAERAFALYIAGQHNEVFKKLFLFLNKIEIYTGRQQGYLASHIKIKNKSIKSWCDEFSKTYQACMAVAGYTIEPDDFYPYENALKRQREEILEKAKRYPVDGNESKPVTEEKDRLDNFIKSKWETAKQESIKQLEIYIESVKKDSMSLETTTIGKMRLKLSPHKKIIKYFEILKNKLEENTKSPSVEMINQLIDQMKKDEPKFKKMIEKIGQPQKLIKSIISNYESAESAIQAMKKNIQYRIAAIEAHQTQERKPLEENSSKSESSASLNSSEADIDGDKLLGEKVQNISSPRTPKSEDEKKLNEPSLIDDLFDLINKAKAHLMQLTKPQGDGTPANAGPSTLDSARELIQVCERQLKAILDPGIYRAYFEETALVDEVKRQSQPSQTLVVMDTQWIQELGKLFKNAKSAIEKMDRLAPQFKRNEAGITDSYQPAEKTPLETLHRISKESGDLMDASMQFLISLQDLQSNPFIKQFLNQDGREAFSRYLNLSDIMTPLWEDPVMKLIFNREIYTQWLQKIKAQKDGTRSTYVAIVEPVMSIWDDCRPDQLADESVKKTRVLIDRLLDSILQVYHDTLNPPNSNQKNAFNLAHLIELATLIDHISQAGVSLHVALQGKFFDLMRSLNRVFLNLYLAIDKIEMQFYLRQDYWLDYPVLQNASIKYWLDYYNQCIEALGFEFPLEERYPFCQRVYDQRRAIQSAVEHKNPGAAADYIQKRVDDAKHALDAEKEKQNTRVDQAQKDAKNTIIRKIEVQIGFLELFEETSDKADHILALEKFKELVQKQNYKLEDALYELSATHPKLYRLLMEKELDFLKELRIEYQKLKFGLKLIDSQQPKDAHDEKKPHSEQLANPNQHGPFEKMLMGYLDQLDVMVSEWDVELQSTFDAAIYERLFSTVNQYQADAGDADWIKELGALFVQLKQYIRLLQEPHTERDKRSYLELTEAPYQLLVAFEKLNKNPFIDHFRSFQKIKALLKAQFTPSPIDELKNNPLYQWSESDIGKSWIKQIKESDSKLQAGLKKLEELVKSSSIPEPLKTHPDASKAIAIASNNAAKLLKEGDKLNEDPLSPPSKWAISGFVITHLSPIFRLLSQLSLSIDILKTAAQDEALKIAQEMNLVIRNIALLIDRFEMQFYLKSGYVANLKLFNGISFNELEKLYNDTVEAVGYEFNADERYPYGDAILNQRKEIEERQPGQFTHQRVEAAKELKCRMDTPDTMAKGTELKQKAFDLIEIEINRLKKQREQRFFIFENSRKSAIQDQIHALEQFKKILGQRGFNFKDGLAQLKRIIKTYDGFLSKQKPLLRKIENIYASISSDSQHEMLGRKQIDFLKKEEKRVVLAGEASCFNLIEKRITELSGEVRKTCFTRTKKQKLVLLRALKENLETMSLDEAIHQIQEKPDCGHHFSLLLEGRTGKLMQRLQFISLSKQDMLHHIDLEILILQGKQAEHYYFFANSKKALLAKRIVALNTLKEKMNLSSQGDTIDQVLSQLDLSQKTILKKHETVLIKDLTLWTSTRMTGTQNRRPAT